MKPVEEDYVCAYQLQLGAGRGHEGAAHDERGRSGDVRLEPLDESKKQ